MGGFATSGFDETNCLCLFEFDIWFGRNQLFKLGNGRTVWNPNLVIISTICNTIPNIDLSVQVM